MKKTLKMLGLALIAGIMLVGCKQNADEATIPVDKLELSSGTWKRDSYEEKVSKYRNLDNVTKYKKESVIATCKILDEEYESSLKSVLQYEKRIEPDEALDNRKVLILNEKKTTLEVIQYTEPAETDDSSNTITWEALKDEINHTKVPPKVEITINFDEEKKLVTITEESSYEAESEEEAWASSLDDLTSLIGEDATIKTNKAKTLYVITWEEKEKKKKYASAIPANLKEDVTYSYLTLKKIK